MKLNRRDWLRCSLFGSLVALPCGRLAFGAEHKPPKTLLLISGWQDINIGDITHTTGLLRILETRLPETKIILWKSKPDNSPQGMVLKMIGKYFPNVEVILGNVSRDDFSFSGNDVLRAVERADVFVHGSGPSVVRWDALAAWSQATTKPFGIFGTTIQNITPDLKKVLEKAAFIYTRETTSLDVLAKNGIAREHQMFVPDATFALHTRDDSAGDAFLKERRLEDRKFLCVIPRLRWTPHPGRLEREPEKHETNEEHKEIDHAKAREAIIAWVETTKLPVLVCPEMTYQVDIMDELLIDPLPDSIRPFVQKRGYWMPDEAASLYARAHTVISFECHSPIIATAMGTPTFHLRQPEDTIKGQMYYDLGMDDWVFEIEQTTGKQIADRLLEVVADYPAALEKVKRVNTLTSTIYDKATLLI